METEHDRAERDALRNLERRYISDTTKSSAGETKLFRWLGYRCIDADCYIKVGSPHAKDFTPPGLRPNFVCKHLRHVIESQLDIVAGYHEWHKSAGIDPTTAWRMATSVVAPMQMTDRWSLADRMADSHTGYSFGVQFPHYVDHNTDAIDPVRGDLWLIRVSGNTNEGFNFVFETKLEEAATFGSPRSTSMLSVRRLGFAALASLYFEGAHCTDELHDINGGEVGVSPSHKRNVASSLHRDVQTLAEIARIVMFDTCSTCHQRKDNPIGLADL